jgi:hypothetical protein
LLVIDGSPGLPAGSIDAITNTLKSELPRSVSMRMAFFDAEAASGQKGGAEVRKSGSEILQVRPRTPLREVLASSISLFGSGAAAGDIVLIVHEESYPSSISAKRLVESAQQAEIGVYAILLAEPTENPGMVRRVGQAFRSAALWLVEGLLDEPRNPKRKTAALLKEIAEGTRGYTCAVTDETSANACAATIVSRLRDRE